MKKVAGALLLVLCLLIVGQPVALADEPMVGEIKLWPGTTIPDGWLPMFGQAVNSSDYPELCAVLGTTYGSVGAGGCVLPNLKGRVVVGLDYAGTNAEFDTLGETGGAKTHTLTINEMPAHTHTDQTFDGGTPAALVVQSGTGANIKRSNATSGSTGGGQPHNNLQPYITLHYIIYSGVGVPTPTPTATPTITPTPTATATPNPGGQQTGPITGTITGSLVITQALPGHAFTTTLSTGNEFVFIRGASYGEIIAGAGGVIVVMVLVFYFVSQHAKRSE